MLKVIISSKSFTVCSVLASVRAHHVAIFYGGYCSGTEIQKMTQLFDYWYTLKRRSEKERLDEARFELIDVATSIVDQNRVFILENYIYLLIVWKWMTVDHEDIIWLASLVD